MFSSASLLQRIGRDERGGVAIIFGLSAIVMLTLSGIAIDYSRVNHEYARISASVDAAALAAGKAILDGRLNDAEVRQIAQSYFDKNVEGAGPGYGILQNLEIEIDRNENGVRITANVAVPMTISRVAGIDNIDLPVTAATKFLQKDIELALALDVTGSMAPAGKLDELKRSAKDMFEMLLPDGGTPNKVRIGLAPYSSGVNAGAYATAATGGYAARGCTFERQGSDQATDAAPASGSYLKKPGDYGISSNAQCPSARVVPLTNDRSRLEREVDGYVASGSTAGHTGAMWASYLLSPKWAGIFGGESPVPYNDGKTLKAMVLMTDGLFNTLGGRHYGNTSYEARQSQQYAVAVCERLRRDGVMVYTIGFELDQISNRSEREAAEQTLIDCAGNPKNYFDASDSGQLSFSFQAIANELNRLRLTN